MNEELEVLALVVARLDAAGIEYMITDSFALAVYATPRMTRDIDSPEDLVLANLLWRGETGSEQQLRDIRSVIASVPDLNREYLSTWAGRLGLTGELTKLTAS